MTTSLAGVLALALGIAGQTPDDAASAVPSSSSRAPAEESVQVAVLPLRVEGLKLNEVQRLDVLVRARVEMRGRMQVQAKETTNKLVDSAQALGLDCDLRAVDCAARLGRLADVSYVIVGEAAGLGDEIGLEMRLVDVETAKVRREVRALLPADPDAQLGPLNAFFTSLFDGDVPLSSLGLSADQTGVAFLIDGIPAESLAPGQTMRGLLPGEHVVSASKDGYLPTTIRLKLDASAPAQHTLHLEVDPSLRPVPPTVVEVTLPLAATAVSVAALAAGIGTTVYGLQSWLAFQQGQAALFDLSPTRASYPSEVQALHGDLEVSAAEWNDSGRYFATGGAVAASVALLAAIGATTWSIAVLTRAADAASVE